jgi:hypothetical protein
MYIVMVAVPSVSMDAPKFELAEYFIQFSGVKHFLLF